MELRKEDSGLRYNNELGVDLGLINEGSGEIVGSSLQCLFPEVCVAVDLQQDVELHLQC